MQVDPDAVVATASLVSWEAELARGLLRLHSEGLSVSESADRLKCSVTVAVRLLDSCRDAVRQMTIDEQRQAMLEKLILAEQTLMEVMNTRHFTVSDGRVVAHPDTGLALEDNDPRIRAATALSMVVMRHSKLIGADMPVRLEIKDVTVSSTGRTVEEELNALADELGLNDAQPG